MPVDNMAGGSTISWTEKLFKVLVIGDSGVGKSSVVLRYVHKRFNETYKSSLGVDFALKTFEWSPKTVVRMQLWDIAGQDRFKNLSRVYYRGAMGALVVFDITNSSTLEAASEWKRDLDSKLSLDSGRSIPAVLLANKCDMAGKHRDVMNSLNDFCRVNSFVGWFETSAKENINIDEAGAFLIEQMMLCETELSREEHQTNRIKVSQATEGNQSQSLCCWSPRRRGEEPSDGKKL